MIGNSCSNTEKALEKAAMRSFSDIFFSLRDRGTTPTGWGHSKPNMPLSSLIPLAQQLRRNCTAEALSSDAELWPHMDFGFVPEDLRQM